MEGNNSRSIYWPALGIRQPTPKQDAWVREVQGVQDDNEPWGYAVKKATQEYGRV